MTKISALLHTRNDAFRLGRTLESLRPCDEVVVIDDGSEDDSAKVARLYGATLKLAIPGVTFGAYAVDASYDWVLCLRPNEALSGELEASLLEWKNGTPDDGVPCYKLSVREQNGNGWQECLPEVRLVNRRLMNWVGELPANQKCEMTLSGDLLRFHQP